MMQLLFLAARAVGFSPCLSKSRARATYLHNTDTLELLWMVGGNVNSTWKTVQQYGGSSNIKKRTCIGSQSLASDYIPKGSRISIFFKHLFIWLPWALVVDHKIFFTSCRPFHPGRGLWSMPALSLRYLGLVALLHVISYIPNQGLNKDWVPFVARQVLNMEFLWPPGMSCKKISILKELPAFV